MERLLKLGELKKLWAALDRAPLLTGATYKLRLLTAQRGYGGFRGVHGDTGIEIRSHGLRRTASKPVPHPRRRRQNHWISCHPLCTESRRLVWNLNEC